MARKVSQYLKKVEIGYFAKIQKIQDGIGIIFWSAAKDIMKAKLWHQYFKVMMHRLKVDFPPKIYGICSMVFPTQN